MSEGMKRITAFLAAALIAMPAMATTADDPARLLRDRGVDLAAWQAQTSDLAELEFETSVMKGEKAEADRISALEPAANAGDADAMYDLGDIYSVHLNFEPFSAEAHAKGIFWFEKAAAAGKVGAESRLADIYAHSDFFQPRESTAWIEIPADEAKAYVWYEKAIAHGDTHALMELADLLVKGAGEVPQDYVRAYDLYSRAAAYRHQDAQLALILYYPYGTSVTTYEDFHKRLVRDARAGDANAQWRLGALGLEMGNARSLHKARSWLKKSAAQGNAAGLYYLGESYGYDEVNTGIDMKLVRRAAELGYGPAQEILTIFRENWPDDGSGDEQRLRWVKFNADRDCMSSQFTLASFYETGHGVGQDTVEAAKWKILASRMSLMEATPATASETAGLSEGDAAEAFSRAKAWVEGHTGVSCWNR